MLTPHLPCWPARWPRFAVSAMAHALPLAVLVLSGGAESAPPPGDPRRIVFIPPVSTDDDPRHDRTKTVEADPIPAPDSNGLLDTSAVQLAPAFEVTQLLDALRAWNGVFGVAPAAAPRTILRTLDLEGRLLSDVPQPLSRFFALRVNPEVWRARYGVGDDEMLMALFPLDLEDRIDTAVRAAAAAQGATGSASIVAAAFSFEPRRHKPVVIPGSVRWAPAQ